MDLPSLIAGGAIAAGGKFFCDWVLKKKTEPVKRLTCSATYCIDMLSSDEDVEITTNGQALQQPAIVTYQVHSMGNAVAKDVRMRLVSKGGDRIVSYQVFVDEEVKCARLTHRQESKHVVSLEWKFINPRDWISIMALISPFKRVEEVRLEIDGEGVMVEHCGMRMDCEGPDYDPCCDTDEQESGS